MTSAEIRATKFARVALGYSPSLVKAWLADIATCLDAGVSPTAMAPPPWFSYPQFPGYSVDAVDQFVAALGFGESAVPRKPPLIHVTKQYIAECKAERLRVAGLPGTRLLWKRIGASVRESDAKVLDSAGQVLVKRRGEQLTITASGQVLSWHQHRQAWVDATTDEPAFWTIGAHRSRTGDAGALLPGQRWLRFRVHGSKNANAVMTATDESGTSVLWLYKRGPLPSLGLTYTPAAEAIVSPDRELTREVLCVIALAGFWLDECFKSGG